MSQLLCGEARRTDCQANNEQGIEREIKCLAMLANITFVMLLKWSRNERIFKLALEAVLEARRRRRLLNIEE